MEITKKNNFVEFLKKFWVHTIVGIMIFAIALTFALAASLNRATPTSVETLLFKLPMENAVVIKDFSNTQLQNNETLNQWEAHLAIDVTSENSDVFAVLEGQVIDSTYDYLEGNTLTIKHSNGFVSKYSSLSSEELVKKGEFVRAGEKIGKVSESGAGESKMGPHLHFELQLHDKLVDPNDYLDLQSK